MQLKELTVKELLALFDVSTHEQISAYFEDPEIHYIVIFANHFQPDMGLLTVGPGQDCTSLEQAKRAIIDRKFAKFMVRCKHCPPDRKRGETTFGGLVRPIDRSAALESVTPAAAHVAAPAPVPAQKNALTLPPVRAVSAPAVEPESRTVVTPVAEAPVVPVAPVEAAAPALSADVLAEIATREAALAKREKELKTIEDDLKMREDELVDREEYVTQSEESLIEKIQKQERRTAELEQQEENIKKRLEEIARREARIAEFNAKHPEAAV